MQVASGSHEPRCAADCCKAPPPHPDADAAAAGGAAMTARLEDLKPDAQDWGLMGVAPNFLQAF